MIWSTPSSRYAHVVAKSADAGGIGKGALEDDMMDRKQQSEQRTSARIVVEIDRCKQSETNSGHRSQCLPPLTTSNKNG